MATFGQTTTQGGSDNLNPDQVLVTPFTSPSDAGTLTALSMFWNAVGTGGNIKYVIYTSTGTFLAASTGTAISATGFLTLPVSLALTPSTSYWLGVIYQSGSQAYDKGSVGTSFTMNSNSYSSPVNISSPTTVSNYGLTIFATYTPTGGATNPPFRTLLGVGI